MSEIRLIDPSEKEQYHNLIAIAFITDPVARFCYPQPERYMREMPKFVEIYGGSSVELGTCWTIDNYAGACGWIPPGEHVDEEAMGAHLAQGTYPDHLDNIWYFLEEFDKYTPQEPHWYLPMIGVDPRHTGKGLGTRLLNHTLDIIDQKSEIAFLGSSNPRNIPVYERLGFEVMGTIEIGPNVIATPMIRNAR